MQYKAYLLAACLAAGLPMQACSQDVTRKGSEDMMQEISNSRNMQVWDRLMTEEQQKMPENERMKDQEFLQSSVPLGQFFQIPRDNIQSINLYVDNTIFNTDIPLSLDSLKDRVGIDRRDPRGKVSYSIKPNKFNDVINIIENIRSRKANGTGQRKYSPKLDYRMNIEINYHDGKQINISSEGRDWYLNYVEGSVNRTGSDLIYVDLSLRDINILFQYIDKDLIVFSIYIGNDDSFLIKWEQERNNNGQ